MTPQARALASERTAGYSRPNHGPSFRAGAPPLRVAGASYTAVLACALLSGCSTWHPREQRAFAFSVACRTVDMVQTDWAMERGYREINPLMGERPSDGKLMAFTAGMVGATWWLAESFDNSDDRVIAILLATAPCVYAVVHNYNEGVRP